MESVCVFVCVRVSVIGTPFVEESGAEWIPFLLSETEFHSCCPGSSTVVRSGLTATSASWVHAILLPQPPE